MTPQLVRIRRHPIKSIGGEDLDQVELKTAHRLPGDREWAVLTEAGERHAGQDEPGKWLPKSCFMRGAAALSLQAVSGGWQGEQLHLRHPDRPDILANPHDEADKLVDWLRPLWPDNLSAPTRLIRGEAVWTDVKSPWVSILSVSTLRLLEDRMGRALGIERWRGNLWIDGLAPLSEMDMVGQTIGLGPVQLRVTERIGRCDATSANTRTGKSDGDMVASLIRELGQADFGVYAEVVTSGHIAVGDKVIS